MESPVGGRSIGGLPGADLARQEVPPPLPVGDLRGTEEGPWREGGTGNGGGRNHRTPGGYGAGDALGCLPETFAIPDITGAVNSYTTRLMQWVWGGGQPDGQGGLPSRPSRPGCAFKDVQRSICSEAKKTWRLFPSQLFG